MHVFILWCGFVGAWLLFAGPIYQAALELGEEEFDREKLRVDSAEATSVPPVSPWWWLLPPVGYWLQKRRAQQARREIMAHWTKEQTEGFIALTNKATGWFLVAGGGGLLAVNETWDVVEHYEWASWTLFPLVLAMVWVSAAYTVASLRQNHEPLKDS